MFLTASFSSLFGPLPSFSLLLLLFHVLLLDHLLLWPAILLIQLISALILLVRLVAFGSVRFGLGLVQLGSARATIFLISILIHFWFFYFVGAGSAGPLEKGSLFLPIPPNLLPSYPASRVIRRQSPRNSTAGFWS